MSGAREVRLQIRNSFGRQYAKERFDLQSVDAWIDRAGKITLPARKLAEIVRELPSEDVRLDTTGSNQVHLECGDVSYEMLGLSPEQFPSVPTLGDSHVTVDAPRIRRMIRSTVFAASTEEARYTLNGVHFHLTPQRLRMVATDSRRLAVATFHVDGLTDRDVRFIVPVRAADEIVCAFGSANELRIGWDEHQVIVAGDDAVVSGRLVEGEFPPYEQILPTDNPIRMEADREAFLTAVRRVSLLSDPQTLPCG